jgi:hypothetical protein
VIGRLRTRRYVQDTGHKIYTGSGRQGGEPYVLLGVSSMAPCAWCWVGLDQVPG